MDIVQSSWMPVSPGVYKQPLVRRGTVGIPPIAVCIFSLIMFTVNLSVLEIETAYPPHASLPSCRPLRFLPVSLVSVSVLLPCTAVYVSTSPLYLPVPSAPYYVFPLLLPLSPSISPLLLVRDRPIVAARGCPVSIIGRGTAKNNRERTLWQR